ncbi:MULTISPECIES: glycosyltransferase [unclassified Aureimonas]|uniref:glycosyltransferase n=1 Tax=unclassified Aureimonas TaxID=2615206 RepID=UPI0006F70255|nr:MULTISPECIES: glycosyltransferase [unclassified Aureimonas]KQT69807.1 glycosyl transferase [Aureimonas sp. Leaf427]KQT76041.1 glycosyl transferase [Aureimonas sp. Leaf460]
MHLLFISSLLPDHDPASGFELANRAIAQELRRQGARVSFAGFRLPGSRMPVPGEVPLGELIIENALATRGRKAAWVAHALRSGLPVAAAKLHGLGDRLMRERLAAAGPVDGYVLNSIQMPTAYPMLARDKPSIFVAHNVEHRTAAENARNARSRLARYLYEREARLLEAAEARICRDAAAIHTLSRDDGRALGLDGDPRYEPLALTLGRPAAAEDEARRYDIGLIGSWSWAPNRVGLDWFLAEVVPHLPETLTIAIAGRFDGAPPRAPKNVRFLGRVPDAQAFVRSSRVIALATKGGTGIQLKTLETFEEGLPAVATTPALRGVDAVPDNVVVADEPEGFAAGLEAMVHLDREGRSLRVDGAAFAERQRAALASGIGRGLAILDAALSRPRKAAGASRAAPSFQAREFHSGWVGGQ